MTEAKAKTPLGLNYWKLWTASVVSNLGDGIAGVAYPWLASAVTRNPLHIAAVVVVTRLPWLLFSLPAGVITDRVDRRKLVAWMDILRFAVTLGVAAIVLASQANLSSPDLIATGAAPIPANAGLLLAMIYVSAALLGTAEVFRDNAAQTLMPAVVDPENLEKANGRLWGAEMAMNSFVGPPLGGILLAVAFALPFFIDAGSFAVAAALVFLIGGQFRPKGEQIDERKPFWTEMREGISWLWDHKLFRPMAIALGVLNGSAMIAFSTMVLFAQEVLELDATMFGLLASGAAIGGILGSVVAHRVTAALGQGGSLFASVAVMAISLAISGLANDFWLFWAMGILTSGFAVVWNVITVSLRQTLIPDRLLGRVNSVYRFLGWGIMPVGSILGGVVVAVMEPGFGRETALRGPFFVAALITVGLFFYALPRLNTARIEEAKAEAAAAGIIETEA
ncbi:MAG: MFS transporter [Acidimicrobiia bacterium]|nr:MFS transporter [Acidimicrobiia bacterium]